MTRPAALTGLRTRLQEMKLPRGHFIYFLIENDQIKYIGKSGCIMSRLKGHLPFMTYDRAYAFRVAPSRAASVEMAMISHFKPYKNRRVQRPKNLAEILRQYGVIDN